MLRFFFVALVPHVHLFLPYANRFQFFLPCRCGNVAAILELDEHLKREFTIFEAAPQVGLFGWVFFNLQCFCVNIFSFVSELVQELLILNC